MPPSAPSAPPPAAPSAPAPAPSPAPAAAAPAPAAAPAKPSPPPERGPTPDWLAEIDSLDTDRPKKPDPKPDDDSHQKTDVEPPKQEDKPGDKPQVKPDEPPAKPFKAAELRVAYDNLKKEKREVLEPKIQALEAKLKEFEGKAPEDTKPIIEKMSAIEKRNAELEQHIQFIDYQKSKDFLEKYQQPYTEAWTKAVIDFGQLTVKIPGGTDDVTGEPAFSTRTATADDLLYLANLPLSQMDDQAEAMFGKSAPRVIRHVERVRELSDAQNKALDAARKKGGDWAKSRQLQSKAMQQKQSALWAQYNKEISERFPKMFGPEEGDTEGNELLAKGFASADLLFSPPADAKPQSFEQRIQFHALLRNKIANHDRLARKLKTVQSELAETKAALAAYEKSEPPAGKGGGPKAASKGFMEEVDEELRKMDRE